MSYYQKYLKYKNKYLELKNQIGGGYDFGDIVKTQKGNYLRILGKVPDDNPNFKFKGFLYYFVELTTLGLFDTTEDIKNIGDKQMIYNNDISILVDPYQWKNITLNYFNKIEAQEKQEKTEKIRLKLDKEKKKAIERAKKYIIDKERYFGIISDEHRGLLEINQKAIKFVSSEILKAPDTTTDINITTKSELQNYIRNTEKSILEDNKIYMQKKEEHEKNIRLAKENGVSDHGYPILSWNLNENGSYGKDTHGWEIVNKWDLY